MKRIAFVLVAAALAVPAGQATAAAPKGPTLAQFNALKKQVTTLQTQLKRANNEILAAEGVLICVTATTADAFQATWQQEDATLQALGKAPVYGAQTPVSDLNACSDFKITRSHNVPPNASAFAAINALFGHSYRYSALSLLTS
jgi:hypothetical protein